MLTVEEICDFETPWLYCEDYVEIERLKKYPHDEIIYHIKQSDKSNLLTGVDYSDSGSALIIDISPSGHEFLANIRSDTVWCNVKEVSSKIGLKSLKAITQIAAGIVTQIIQHQLGY